MANTSTIEWPGNSGTKYKYYIYEIGTLFKEMPGNYIFAGINNQNKWFSTYIRQTQNLKDRLSDHEKEPGAKQNGATHIHAHISSDNEQERITEEADLIRNFNLICIG